MPNANTLDQRVTKLEKEVAYLRFQNNVLINKDDNEVLSEIREKLIHEKENWEKDDSVFQKGKLEDLEGKIKFVEKFIKK